METPIYTPRILEARPMGGYTVWLRFSDQTSGEVDLSHLAGQGVFKTWDENENFNKFFIESGRRLAWPDDIDIDADSLYLRLTGKTPEQLFPALKEDIHA